LCKGDREQAAELMMKMIVDLWGKSAASEAARSLFRLSDLAKRAGHHQTSVALIRTLEADLAHARTDEDRARITREIQRHLPIAPSQEALRINAVIKRYQVAALSDQRRHANTQDERRQIDDTISRLQSELQP
jgi:hypothetical protein